MKSPVRSAIAVFEEKIATRNNSGQQAGSKHSENELYTTDETKACRSKRRSSLAFQLAGKSLTKESSLYGADPNDKIGLVSSGSPLQGHAKEYVSTLRRRNSLVVTTSPKSPTRNGTVGSQFRSIAPYSSPSSPSKFADCSRPHRRGSMPSVDHKKSPSQHSKVEKDNSSYVTDQRWSPLSPTTATRTHIDRSSAFPTPAKMQVRETNKNSSDASSSIHGIRISGPSGIISTAEFASPKGGHYVMHQVRKKASEPPSQATSVYHENPTPTVASRTRRHSVTGSKPDDLQKKSTAQMSNKIVGSTISQFEELLAVRKEPKLGSQSPVPQKGRRNSMTNGSPRRWDPMPQKISPCAISRNQSGRNDSQLVSQDEDCNGDVSFDKLGGIQSPIATNGRRSSMTSTTPRRRESMNHKNSPAVFSSKLHSRLHHQCDESNGVDSFADSLADIAEVISGYSTRCPMKPNKVMVSRVQGLCKHTLDLPIAPSEGQSKVCGDSDSQNEDCTATTVSRDHDATESSPLRPTRQWGLSFDGSGPMVETAKSMAAERSAGKENEDSTFPSPNPWKSSLDGSEPLVDAAVSIAAERAVILENGDSIFPTPQDHAIGSPLRSNRQWGLSLRLLSVDGDVDTNSTTSSTDDHDQAMGSPLRSNRQWGLSLRGISCDGDVDTNSTTSSVEACELSCPPKKQLRKMMRPVLPTVTQSYADSTSCVKPDPSCSSFLETTTTASTTAVSLGSTSTAHDRPSGADSTALFDGACNIVHNDTAEDDDDAISTLTEDKSVNLSDDRWFPSWDDLLRSRQRAYRKKADVGIAKLCSGTVGIKDRLIQFQRRGPGL
jgi:hypothetical protein